MPKYRLCYDVALDIEVTAENEELADARAMEMIEHMNNWRLPNHMSIVGVYELANYEVLDAD